MTRRAWTSSSPSRTACLDTAEAAPALGCSGPRRRCRLDGRPGHATGSTDVSASGRKGRTSPSSRARSRRRTSGLVRERTSTAPSSSGPAVRAGATTRSGSSPSPSASRSSTGSRGSEALAVPAGGVAGYRPGDVAGRAGRGRDRVRRPDLLREPVRERRPPPRRTRGGRPRRADPRRLVGADGGVPAAPSPLIASAPSRRGGPSCKPPSRGRPPSSCPAAPPRSRRAGWSGRPRLARVPVHAGATFYVRHGDFFFYLFYRRRRPARFRGSGVEVRLTNGCRPLRFVPSRTVPNASPVGLLRDAVREHVLSSPASSAGSATWGERQREGAAAGSAVSAAL